MHDLLQSSRQPLKYVLLIILQLRSVRLEEQSKGARLVWQSKAWALELNTPDSDPTSSGVTLGHLLNHSEPVSPEVNGHIMICTL